MTSFKLRIMAQVLPFLLITPGIALAQGSPTRDDAAAALARSAAPAAAHYTRQQIDQLVAPIALYPDQLLSQVLMAASYPQQIVEAAQWVQDPQHSGLKGDALVAALQPLPWDPSVKALVPFPQVIVMLSEHIDWAQTLGVAFVTQQADVMTRVQALRHLAMTSGQLKKVRHLAIREEGPMILIAPAEPEMVYVPVYNPVVVYGAWPDRDYLPVYLPPPRGFAIETIGPGIEVGVGYAVVAPLWGWSRPDWQDQRLTIERTAYTRITPGVVVGSGDRWQHAGPVVLVAPAAMPRAAVASVPAGTIVPARAGAVVALPQRAAAEPNAIKTQPAAAPPAATHAGPAPSPAAPPPGKSEATATPAGKAPPAATQAGPAPSPAAPPPGKSEATATPAGKAPPAATQAGPAPSPAVPPPGKSEATATPAGKAPPAATHAGPAPSPVVPPTGKSEATATPAGKAPPASAATAATKPVERRPGQTPATTAAPAREQATLPPANRATEHAPPAAAAKPPARAAERAQPPATQGPEHAAAKPPVRPQTPAAAAGHAPPQPEAVGHGSSMPPQPAGPQPASSAKSARAPAGPHPQGEPKDEKKEP